MNSNNELQVSYFSNLNEFKEDIAYEVKRPLTGKKILGIVKDNNIKTVLEFGCGSGVSSSLFKNIKHCAYDLTPFAVEMATKKGIVAKIADIQMETLPIFEILEFDLVFSSEVLEHLVSPGIAINNMFCSLKPGGKLIITTPNINSISNRYRVLKGEIPPYFYLPGHITVFNIGLMRKFLLDAGFKNIKFHNLFWYLPSSLNERIFVEATK